jgi:hypothetical protein
MTIFKFIDETYIKNKKAASMYLARWQCSTPIFIIIGISLSQLPYWSVIVVSNVVGALIFFPIDKYIMKRSK